MRGAAISVGIDIVEIDRIRSLLHRHPRTATRLFTARELAAATGRARASRLAARFAAKEAVLKALGTGAAAGLWFDQVEVTSDERGAPLVSLHGKARERARRLGAREVLVSISHERNHACAVALLVG